MVKLLIIVFPVLLLVSVPVAHAMLGATAFALWMEGKPMAVIAQRLYSPTQSFPMLATRNSEWSRVGLPAECRRFHKHAYSFDCAHFGHHSKSGAH